MSDPELVVLPLLPLHSGVALPGMVVTIALESPEARAAASAARGAEDLVLVVPRVGRGYARVGVVAKIENLGRSRKGSSTAEIRALHRGIVASAVPGTGDATWVQVRRADETNADSSRAGELARDYRATVESIAEGRNLPMVGEFLRGISEPGALADLGGYSPDLAFAQRVEILETLDVEERLAKVLAWAKDTLAEVTVKDRIREEVQEALDTRQREFILREQLEAIRKELGEVTGEGEGNLVDEYRRRIADANLPEGPGREAGRELGRLERTSEQSPEHGWIRTYLDWLTELPWDVRTDDNLDVAAARRILDEDHTGLEDVKDRIVEYLAVRKLRAERGFDDRSRVLADAALDHSRVLADAALDSSRVLADAALDHSRVLADAALDHRSGRGASGAILTLIGPPGVGKTSLGESVARALGRQFVRISLGGVRDEAEIRGHRRTYVGALPGRIVRALKDAGTKNPVMMLDEIDKVGADWRGDPSSALLEVLDPAQNHTFRDHYLDVDLDLSEVLFIATGNVADTIPGALLDRMEIIRLDGYTEAEKVAIARDHLLARGLERNGLRSGEVAVSDEALQAIVIDHTREAGVRNLERELGKLLRKLATRIASGELDPPLVVGATDVEEHLGRPKFFFEVADRTGVPGVATGLAVTGFGGDVLFVEAAGIDGEPGFTITGQLGDVMQESAQIALSYVQANAADLGISPAALDRRFHLHVPAGAVPKDGPSAGVTMTVALVSLLTDRPVRSTVGMTGEMTLQGKVLPIGGVKQKVLAAHRAGLTEVIVPQRNERDLDDVPDQISQDMAFHVAKRIDDVIGWALEPAREPLAAPAA